MHAHIGPAVRATRRRERTGLQPPGLGEGVLLRIGDDEVVQDTQR
jgi:hypothetical protein